MEKSPPADREYGAPSPEELAALFTALASPIRIRLISILNLRDACLEELAEMLERSPATIHYHLRKLTACGLVTSQRRQYYRYYALQREQWGQLHNWFKGALQFNRQLADYDRQFRQGVFAAAFRDGFQGFPPQQRERELLERFFLGHLEKERVYSRSELGRLFSEYSGELDLILKPLTTAGLLQRSGGGYRISDSFSSRKNLK